MEASKLKKWTFWLAERNNGLKKAATTGKAVAEGTALAEDLVVGYVHISQCCVEISYRHTTANCNKLEGR